MIAGPFESTNTYVDGETAFMGCFAGCFAAC